MEKSLTGPPANIDQIVPYSGWNNKGVTLLYADMENPFRISIRPIFIRPVPFSMYKMIQIRMHLQPNIFSQVYAHQRKLQAFSRP
jgi:hypothetical protein